MMSTASEPGTGAPPGAGTPRKAMEAWLSTPESDEPVPDFVERELATPFEIDLLGWRPAEPPPDFAERVLKEVRRLRSRARRARRRGQCTRTRLP